MRVTAHLFILLIVFLATFCSIYWLSLTFIYWFHLFAFLPADEPHWIPTIAAVLCAVLCAVLSGRYVRNRLTSASAGLTSGILLGAFIIGSVGFCIGFLGGPIIFFPGSNQGPLLGFITGPLGFILGGVGGFLYWMHKHSQVL